MLVLSLKAGQRVMIGEDIVITVVELRPWIVKIGIEAPRCIPVHREEVLRAIKEQQRANTSRVQMSDAEMQGSRDGDSEGPVQ